MIAALAAALVLVWSAGPLHDLDSYFHAQLGRQIAQLHRVTDLPSWWLGVQPPHDWTTSQWLAELGLYAASSPGWRGLIWLNLALMVLLISSLAIVLLRRRHAAIAVPVFLLALLGSFGGIQERPASVSLILLVWLGAACGRMLDGGRRPPLALVAVLSLFWAQVHGLWIIAPLAFALVAAGGLLDRLDRVDRRSARPALLCVLASLAGLVNPHGLGSFVLPFRFADASVLIEEWQPTRLNIGFTLCWGLLVALTVLAWARSGCRVALSELLWIGAWTGFGLLSYRNVAPALLLTAPVTLSALTRLRGPAPDSGVAADEAEQPSAGRRRETVLLAATAAIVLIAGLVFACGRAASVSPEARTPAAGIAAWVAQQSKPIRIWNAANSSGALIGLSDGKARLSIDGRADLWGRAYNVRMDDATLLRPGWLETITRFAPQAVVVPRDRALTEGLLARGWRIQVQDGAYVLLIPNALP